jgi:type IV secretory pathway VirB10-like protein
MNWVLDNLNIVIAIAAGIAYWLNNMRVSKEEARRQAEEPPPEESEDVFGPDFDFGEPETSPPTDMPPPLFRQPVPPPLPAAVDAGELARQAQIQERLREARENKAANRSSTEVSRSWIQARDRPKKPPTPSGGIKTRLRNTREIRKAFVMREILGPPVALRR